VTNNEGEWVKEFIGERVGRKKGKEVRCGRRQLAALACLRGKKKDQRYRQGLSLIKLKKYDHW